MHRTRFAGTSAAAFAGLTLLSACGVTTDDAVPAAPPPGGAELVAVEVGGFGMVVANSDGKTLYRYDKDTAAPPRSTCDGRCKAMWPPAAPGTGESTVQGVDKRLVGTITREDGTRQLTLAGWPLYTFVKDTAPGQIHGHAMNHTWFAATPDGRKAADPVVPVPAGSGSGGDGY